MPGRPDGIRVGAAPLLVALAVGWTATDAAADVVTEGSRIVPHEFLLEQPADARGFTLWRAYADSCGALVELHAGERSTPGPLPFRVLAIADGHEAEFAALRTGTDGGAAPLAELIARPWVAATDRLSLDHAVSEWSSVDSIVTTVSVRPAPSDGARAGDGRLGWRLEASTVMLDGDGDPVDDRPGLGFLRRRVVPVGIVLMGGAWLLARRRRRVARVSRRRA